MPKVRYSLAAGFKYCACHILFARYCNRFYLLTLFDRISITFSHGGWVSAGWGVGVGSMGATQVHLLSISYHAIFSNNLVLFARLRTQSW